VTEFIKADVTEARFDGVNLRQAGFHDVDLSGADFRLVDLELLVLRTA
jgi:uncharacterized protein YjbI with pentapeptide repeats